MPLRFIAFHDDDAAMSDDIYATAFSFSAQYRSLCSPRYRPQSAFHYQIDRLFRSHYFHAISAQHIARRCMKKRLFDFRQLIFAAMFIRRLSSPTAMHFDIRRLDAEYVGTSPPAFERGRWPRRAAFRDTRGAQAARHIEAPISMISSRVLLLSTPAT